ncbi:HEC/Ndc80p family protein [Teladorsagia circumcincta]|uniref:Kinetochore protein NDC80 n=1 Tax=Teladorsagia circumcincta TaxID=45464 RepID=A0A2G9V4P9_TELCI|nr:HEC/Ndc80p family protein [Teladorsagia circumcincta]
MQLQSDTRPLSSKEYQGEMVRTIYEFLLEHDGENCLPERVIRSPTKQDFICMFESIYQHLNPDFQLKNVIEEVPAIFRELGYPTAIKPSTMQTIGAAHSWPTLLDKIQALRQWYEQQEDFDTQKKAIEANLEQIVEECKELEADKGKVERIQEDIARLDEDIAKATEYKEETEQHEKQLAEQLETVNLEVAAVREQSKEYHAKLAEVESAIKAQEEGEGLCGTEARALIAEVDQVEKF